MNRKLTAKIQKINPRLADQAYNVSNCLIINPDDEQSLEKKGVVYATFDISGKEPVDTLLTTKIVNDVLHDSYYQSESASPIQAIEKSVLKLRDNLVQNSNTIFNIATAVLWGNTLYLVQYGNTKIFLVREGKVKPIESATEGKFSVASGVVKDNDVVILATDEFSKKYPVEKLVIGNSPVDNLDELDACLILKFVVIKEFSEDEVIRFSPQNTETKETREIHDDNTSTVFDKKTTINLKVPTIPVAKILSSRWVLIAGAVLLAILLISLGVRSYSALSSRNNDIKGQEDPPQNIVNNTKPTDDETTIKQAILNKESTSIFYDIKLTDTTAQPTEIAVAGANVYVTDKSGKLFVSQRLSPKFIDTGTNVEGARSLANYKGNLGFVDSSGFKVLDNTHKVAQTFSNSNLGATTTYLDFIYSISGDVLTRYSKSGSSLTGSVWAQNSALTNSLGMGIDFSIYILTNDNKVLKFTTGKQDAFELTGLARTAGKYAQINTDVDLKNIYLLDVVNNSIVVVDKDGKFIKEIEVFEQIGEESLISMGISDDETKAYVLAGSRVYEVKL
jgi:hypothetical protein